MWNRKIYFFIKFDSETITWHAHACATFWAERALSNYGLHARTDGVVLVGFQMLRGCGILSLLIKKIIGGLEGMGGVVSEMQWRSLLQYYYLLYKKMNLRNYVMRCLRYIHRARTRHGLNLKS